MINYIKIGGKERPIAFGHRVAYNYEVQTGHSYNALVLQVADMITKSATAMPGTDDLELEDAAQILHSNSRKAAESFSIVPLTKLTYIGLAYAHRKEGIPVDFEEEDVAEWLFDDPAAMQAVFVCLFESLPKGEAKEEGKKKTEPRPSPARRRGKN